MAGFPLQVPASSWCFASELLQGACPAQTGKGEVPGIQRPGRNPQSMKLHHSLSAQITQEVCCTGFLRGSRGDGTPVAQEPAHEWNFTGLSLFPLFPPYPPSMWFMGSISPGKLPAWVLVLGLAFEEIQDEMGGFPGGASGKELTCQCRRWKRHGFNPWVRKNPWRRAQKPTPASCLENPIDGWAWWATSHRVAKSWTRQVT